LVENEERTPSDELLGFGAVVLPGGNEPGIEVPPTAVSVWGWETAPSRCPVPLNVLAPLGGT